MLKFLTLLLCSVVVWGCESQQPKANPPIITETEEVPIPVDFASAKASKERTDLPYYATQAVASVNGTLISAEKFNHQVDMSFRRTGYDPAYEGATCKERLGKVITIDEALKKVVDFELVRQASEPKIGEISETYLDHRFEIFTARGGWAFTPQEPYYAAQLEEMEYFVQAFTKDEFQKYLRTSESMILWLAEHPSIQSSVGYRQEKGTFKIPEVFMIQRVSIPKTDQAAHATFRKGVEDRLAKGESFESIAKSIETTHPVAGRPFYWKATDYSLKQGDLFEKEEKVGPYERYSLYRVVKFTPSVALQGTGEERAMAREVVLKRFHGLIEDVATELRPKAEILLNREGIAVKNDPTCPVGDVRISEAEAWKIAQEHLRTHDIDVVGATYELSSKGEYGSGLQKDFRFVIKSKKMGVRLVDVDGHSKMIRRSILLSN